MALFAAEGQKPGNKPPQAPQKAWESQRYEHLRWSFPETFANVKRAFSKREEWRTLEAMDEEDAWPTTAAKSGGTTLASPPTALALQRLHKLLPVEGTSVGARLARAFQRREKIEVARLKYLGSGDDGGKGRALFVAKPCTFEESGSVVPQRALRVRSKKSANEEEESSKTLTEAERLENEQYWNDRRKLRMITAQRHTSRNRKPNGGFYSSDTVAGKIWEYHTPEYSPRR